MKIANISPLNFTTLNNKKSELNTRKASFKGHSSLPKDTFKFGRTFDNIDKNTQLYRGVGDREIRALFEGKTIDGESDATTNPMGYIARTWDEDGGYGDYFIAFNKDKIDFRDHRSFDTDTKYMVDDYNLADVNTIRKGRNNHGELVYSTDFENGKSLDIKNKQAEIKKAIKNLKSIKLTEEERINNIALLKSYSKEFPHLEKVIEFANKPFGRFLLRAKGKSLTPSADKNEDRAIMSLFKSITPQKVKEFDAIRNLGDKARRLNNEIEALTEGGYYSKEDMVEYDKSLKDKCVKIEARLESLNKIEQKNAVEKFEIETFSKIVKDIKSIKI